MKNDKAARKLGSEAAKRNYFFLNQAHIHIKII